MTQAVSRRPVITEAQIQSQASLCVHINNNITLQFRSWLLILQVNSQMTSYINITTYIHKLTKDNKQETNEADNKYTRKNTTQTEQKQYGRKINVKV